MLAERTLAFSTSARPCRDGGRRAARCRFWYAGPVRSSVSIVLFFLLSGFFLAALVGAIERNRRLIGIAGACLVVLVSIIVFVKPVQLPSLSDLRHGTTTTTTSTTAASSEAAPAATAPASTTAAPASTTAAPGTSSTTAAPGTTSTGAPSGY